MKKDKLQPMHLGIELIQEGDVLMPIGKKFMARSIQFFMNLLKKRENIKTKLNPNHADRARIFNGELSVVGMVPNPDQKGLRGMMRTGLYTRPLLQDYGKEFNYIVLTPIIPYTQNQLQNIEDYTNECEARSVRYGTLDIACQMWYSGTGHWIGKSKDAGEDRLICTEFIANGENKAIPKAFPEPWHVNPVEVMEYKGYRIKNIDYEYYKQLALNYKK